MERADIIKWNGELFQLILRCYTEVTTLEELERYKSMGPESNKGMIKAAQEVVEQMEASMRCDLVVNLWKLYYNPDKNGRTLFCYRAAMRKFLHENLIVVAIKKRMRKPWIVELGDDVCYLRERYLTQLCAPEDMDTLFLQKVKTLLEMIREQFNETCRKEIDEALMPINKAMIKKQQFSTTLGLSWMLENSKVKREEWEKGE